LGRIPTAAEKAEAIASVQAAENAAGGLTSGPIPSVDPASMMTEYFRKKQPGEAGAKNIAQAFDVFASILGPGGGIGQNANIDLGNPKIGT
jgi:hypothetical protein